MTRTSRMGLLLIAASLALIVAGAGIWLVVRRSPLERAQEAYRAGKWTEARAQALEQLARSKHDADALRLVARCDAHLGGPAALSGFLGLPDAQLGSADFVLIGQALLAQQRTVLGWAALDAATKLDPKNGEAAAALATLHGRIEGLGDVVRQADRFKAISDGRALGSLVLGILRLGRKPTSAGGFDSWVDKVLQRERAALVRLDPAGVTRLLVRFLLEDGRNDEARTVLAHLPADGTDPEAAWLLSRIELEAGHAEAASQALEKARGFGSENPLAHEPSRYAGARTCLDCHGAIYRAQQSSRHALTIGTGAALESVPLPAGPVVDPVRPDVVHRFERKGQRIEVEARVASETVRAVIDYALGSGHHGVTMVGRDEKGVNRSLRISYYTNGKAWDITSGYDPRPAEAAEYIGKSLSTEGLRTCLDCHTTQFRSLEDRKGPEAHDKGIGCEKCHGPSARHILAVDSGFPQLAIARPKIATPAQRLTLCSPCHGADGIIPPSDPRFVRFQSTTLPFSKCYTESGAKFDCIACHSPHHDVETSAGYYEQRCLACHAAAAAPRPDPSLRLEAVKSPPCPVNPRGGCIGCHMPKSENVIPFTAFTDHHIRVHQREATTAAAP